MMKTKTKTAKKAAYTGDIPQTPFRFIWFYARKQPVIAITAVTCVTLAQTASSFSPFVLKQIVDAAIVSGDKAEQVQVAVYWGIIYVLLLSIMWFLWRLSGFIGIVWLTNIRKWAYIGLYSYLVTHSHQYFVDRFAGSVVNKVSHAADGVERMMEDTLWRHYPGVIGLIVSGILMVLVNPLIGFLYVLLIVVILIINIPLVRYRRPFVVEYAKSASAFKGQAIDVFSNVSAVRQYVRQDQDLLLLDRSSDLMRLIDIRQWKLSEWSLVLNNILIIIILGSIIYVMNLLFQSGDITVGDVILIFSLIFSTSHTLVFIGSSMNGIIRMYGEIQEGIEDVLLPHEITDIEGAKNLKTNGGKMDWQDVTFEFDANRVFDEFNLSIEPGQRVGLVGPSGAGKTTFVSLLLRQHDINAGNILIDDQNIAEVTQDSLRENIAVVPQEPLLFHRTIRENIAYGKPEATNEEIIAVAQKAQAHEFIIDLPEGYDTLVGERGVKLSGGQKQRVAIARAMLKDAPILVLDEATSALDSESEVEIQKALQILMKGKTVVAIAHRLSTLRKMDRILVLEKGKIVEDGTHDELTKNGGTYQRLWEHQAGGFLQG